MAGPLRLAEGERPPTASSSVLVVRDGGDGVEVLMLERHLDSDFVGGALVFPGGKVDPADGALAADRWRGPEDLAADARALGVADGDAAVARRVAAVRETFEEAGILLAHHADGRPVTAADLAEPDAIAARASLIDRGPVADWHAWLTEADLVLDLAALAPWSWWVTPEGSHRRFDTTFFVVVQPPEQRDAAAHDEVEVTSSRWVTPRAALTAHRGREAMVIFPTRCNLEELDGHASAEEAVTACLPRRLEMIIPTITVIDGVTHVEHPDGRPPEQP